VEGSEVEMLILSTIWFLGFVFTFARRQSRTTKSLDRHMLVSRDMDVTMDTDVTRYVNVL
jgi:hypothetical protein